MAKDTKVRELMEMISGTGSILYKQAAVKGVVVVVAG